ncbi:unnamed protein product [Notodromas monacha]|uniref:Uncharacterized protein n=1 Tax=Notodromas monacha TaxID=399045 RepID=A0A7R9BQ85_9CRUS|nr:unnamed protein product [Notodromas monacha]CAG0919650.1 unnamed protein product [Notodromas monacha]
MLLLIRMPYEYGFAIPGKIMTTKSSNLMSEANSQEFFQGEESVPGKMPSRQQSPIHQEKSENSAGTDLEKGYLATSVNHSNNQWSISLVIARMKTLVEESLEGQSHQLQPNALENWVNLMSCLSRFVNTFNGFRINSTETSDQVNSSLPSRWLCSDIRTLITDFTKMVQYLRSSRS